MDQRSQKAMYHRILADERACWGHLAGIPAFNLLSAPLTLLLPFPSKIAIESAIGTRPLPLVRSRPIGARSGRLHRHDFGERGATAHFHLAANLFGRTGED